MNQDIVKASSQAKHGPESDLKKLVRLHLSDPNHVITEDEFRKVEVGSKAELLTSTDNINS